ncbi:hypothetical protein DENSPDRAFT_463959 [Dentipellis sp. KUC8613]|nr:hypothetical protein DENSPDRAFT_463959 [Dentipellis sp. KUC8613]
MPPRPRMVRKNAPNGVGIEKPTSILASLAASMGPSANSQSQPQPQPQSHPPPQTQGVSAPPTSKSPSKEGTMLPPPDPKPPKAILEPEMDMLSGCLRNTAVKMGQVYGFYADVRRLGIRQFAPRPPQSLTASLGREVEKYDQLCDAMESHLLYAISVLQRDLDREKARLQAEADAAAAAAKEAEAQAESVPVIPNSVPAPAAEPLAIAGPSSPTSKAPISVPHTPKGSPPIPSSVPSARRQSTISLSSLNRAQFPHKLDLSATALRINPEEISQLGPASPVTLAPRSGRLASANDYAPDFMAALTSGDLANRPVDIDLTSLPDSEPANAGNMPVDALGSSADRPIELDMDIDMTSVGDLFGDSEQMNSADQDLFGPSTSEVVNVKEEKDDNEKLGMDILSAFSASNPDAVHNDLFGSLDTNQAQGSADNDLFSPAPAAASSGDQPALSAASPGTILAGFAASNAAASSSTDNPSAGGADPQFDMSTLDFSNYTSLDPGFSLEGSSGADQNIFDMETLFNMGDNNHTQSGS